MSKERIYGRGKSGCLYETVHREEFEASASMVDVSPASGETVKAEKGKTYIVKKSTATTAWGFTISVALRYTVSGTTLTKTVNLVLPTYDKYANGIKFKYLDYGSTSTDLVYEINGTRSTRVLHDADTVTYSEVVISFSGADIVYLVNEEAQVLAVGKQGEAGEDGIDTLVFTDFWRYEDDVLVGGNYTAEPQYFNRTPVVGDIVNIVGINKENKASLLQAEITSVSTTIIDFTLKNGVYLSGRDGERGATGEAGKDGAYVQAIRSKGADEYGNNLYDLVFTNGASYEFIAPRGATGATGANGDGISSIVFTNSKYDGAGQIVGNIYTINLTNGNTYTFTAPCGPTGAKIVRTEYYSTDENGNVTYRQVFDNNTYQYFEAPRGPKGDGANLYSYTLFVSLTCSDATYKLITLPVMFTFNATNSGLAGASISSLSELVDFLIENVKSNMTHEVITDTMSETRVQFVIDRQSSTGENYTDKSSNTVAAYAVTPIELQAIKNNGTYSLQLVFTSLVANSDWETLSKIKTITATANADVSDFRIIKNN